MPPRVHLGRLGPFFDELFFLLIEGKCSRSQYRPQNRQIGVVSWIMSENTRNDPAVATVLPPGGEDVASKVPTAANGYVTSARTNNNRTTSTNSGDVKEPKNGCPYGALNIPKMMPNFVCISLHDVEGADGAGLRVRRRHVTRRVEGGILPRVGNVDQGDQSDDGGEAVVGADTGYHVLVPHGNAERRVRTDASTVVRSRSAGRRRCARRSDWPTTTREPPGPPGRCGPAPPRRAPPPARSDPRGGRRSSPTSRTGTRDTAPLAAPIPARVGSWRTSSSLMTAVDLRRCPGARPSSSRRRTRSARRRCPGVAHRPPTAPRPGCGTPSSAPHRLSSGHRGGDRIAARAVSGPSFGFCVHEPRLIVPPARAGSRTRGGRSRKSPGAPWFDGGGIRVKPGASGLLGAYLRHRR